MNFPHLLVTHYPVFNTQFPLISAQFVYLYLPIRILYILFNLVCFVLSVSSLILCPPFVDLAFCTLHLQSKVNGEERVGEICKNHRVPGSMSNILSSLELRKKTQEPQGPWTNVKYTVYSFEFMEHTQPPPTDVCSIAANDKWNQVMYRVVF